MHFICPCCGARVELDAAVADEQGRVMMGLVAKLGGELPHLAVVYLGCFRPRGRVLSWARACRLMGELLDAIEAGAIRRRRRRWTVTREQWAEALRTVIERRDAGQLEVPLRNHAYLWEVACRLSDRAEAAGERAVEEARRRRGRDDAPIDRGGVPAGAPRNLAQHWEWLLAEARRLGVDIGPDGLVRSLPDMETAVRQARLQEDMSDAV